MAKNFREDIVVTSSVADTSGLQLENLLSTSPVTVGSVALGVDAVGNVVIADTSGAVGGVYTTRTAKLDNTVYQAGPNGGVLTCWRDNGFFSLLVEVYSDASVLPTTLVGQHRVHEFGEGASITVPILPNMYYFTTNADAGAIFFYEI